MTTKPSTPSHADAADRATTPAPALGPWRADQRLAVGGAAEVWSLDAAGLPAAVWKIAHYDVPEAHDALEREWRALHSIAVDVLPEPLLWTPPTATRGPGIIMRRLDGAPMAEVFADLDVERASGLIADALAALAVVHDAGLVHGDLHAGNVMVEAHRGRARLLDLGLAQADGPPIAPGVPACAAPERLRRAPVHPADDLFSLAWSIAAARGWPAPHPDHPALSLSPTARPRGPEGAERGLFDALARGCHPCCG